MLNLSIYSFKVLIYYYVPRPQGGTIEQLFEHPRALFHQVTQTIQLK